MFVSIRRHLCKRTTTIFAISMLLVLSTVCEAQIDFRGFVDTFRRDDEAVLYSECLDKMRKALLIITLKQKMYDIWLFEVEGGWLLQGTQVVIKGNNFEFIDPPGGEGTRAKIRRYVESLMKGPFEFLMPNETEKLRFSVPKTGCPK